jgi:hypothetical protein
VNALLYLLFLSFFTLEWIAFRYHAFGRVATWLPEILSLIAVASVIILVTVRKSFCLQPKYIAFFFLFLLIISGGIVINQVSPEVMLAGLRNYLKYMPFFFLPVVYKFSDEQLRKQLKFLLLLSLLQLPVTLYQKFIEFKQEFSGDPIGGTLGVNTSGVLSVYLICVISLTIAFYLKKRIKLLLSIFLILSLFIPTTLNETKITFFILPIAFLIPFIMEKSGYKKKITMVFVLGIAMIIFVFIYDHFRSFDNKNESAILQFITKEDRFKNYLYSRADPHRAREVSRIDSIILAIKYLSKDGNLLLGVGVGNASPSFSKDLSGEYYKKYQFAYPNNVYLSLILWEMGVVGIILYCLFFYLVVSDSIYLKNRNDLTGALSLGWIAVVILMIGSFIYFATFNENLFGYLFWYISGYIAGQRYRYENNLGSYELHVSN